MAEAVCKRSGAVEGCECADCRYRRTRFPPADKGPEVLAQTTKATNPKDAIGSRKAPPHVIPSVAVMETALAMLDGGCKYGSHNYRVAGIRSSVYYDAIDRHMKAWWEGEDRASDSGVHHLGHVMACCAIILDAVANGKLTDDRPPAMTPGWIAEFNARANEILQRYPEPKAPYVDKINGN